MTDQTTQLVLDIGAGPDTDLEELADLTLQLREELWELDLDTVDLVRAGEVPERAKAGDPIAWGDLVLTLVTSSAALVTLISTLKAWLKPYQRRDCSVTIELDGDRLEVTGISSEEQQYLIDTWLRRHGGV